MSVRLNGTGTGYNATLTSGTQTALTMCAWVNLAALQSIYAGIIGVAASTAGTDFNSLVIGTSASSGADAGRDLRLDSSGTLTWTSANTILLTVGTWTFVALTTSGVNYTLYGRSATDTAFTTVSGTGADSSITATTWSAGWSVYGDDPLNGDIIGARLWLAQLTAAELAQEYGQLLPYRRANLRVAHALTATTNLGDYSGNALTLTGGSAAVNSTGPGVPWFADRVQLPAARPALIRASTW